MAMLKFGTQQQEGIRPFCHDCKTTTTTTLFVYFSLMLVVCVATTTDVKLDGGGDVGYFTLEVTDIGPTSVVEDGVHLLRVPLKSGDEMSPLARVRSFGRAHGFSGAQQQEMLDLVCAKVGCEEGMDVLPKLSDYIVSGEKAKKTTVADDNDAAPPDGTVPWSLPSSSSSSSKATTTDVWQRSPPPPITSLPLGMHLARSVVVGERRHELFVIDNVTAPDVIAFWAGELDSAPFRRAETDFNFKNDPRFSRPEDHYRALSVEFDLERIQNFPTGGGHEVFARVRQLVGALWPDETMVLHRVSGNAALYGGMYFTHTDFSPHEPHVTLIYYANARWERSWYGDTVFIDGDEDKDDEPLYVVAPRPGRVAAFRGAVKHRVGEPSRHCEVARLTMVFKFKSFKRAPAS